MGRMTEQIKSSIKSGSRRSYERYMASQKIKMAGEYDLMMNWRLCIVNQIL